MFLAFDVGFSLLVSTVFNFDVNRDVIATFKFAHGFPIVYLLINV